MKMIYFAQQTDSVVRICAAFKENSEIRTTNAEKTVCLKKKKKKRMQAQKEPTTKKRQTGTDKLNFEKQCEQNPQLHSVFRLQG